MLLSLTCQQIVYQVKVKLSAIIDDTGLRVNWHPPNFAMVHKVAIVGGGSWGSALSVIVGESVERKKHLFDTSVKLWLLREEVNGEDLAELINRQHENVKYLPGIQLPRNIVNQN
ncbi:Glycerol-3-phosphate dehydrogenase 1-like protein [Trichinella patagoniensis]|uniref:Glycerol-3-phosphate dehydrogenase 1-like protein n=1 Tax=Trichinella patagoniensis TaxID=990121 RepID=A0A0V0ZU22_9BILA|nr:Glycerol-3-phosphate dehydrogenase 1-like protein [Trichinella patagoniensis]